MPGITLPVTHMSRAAVLHAGLLGNIYANKFSSRFGVAHPQGTSMCTASCYRSSAENVSSFATYILAAPDALWNGTGRSTGMHETQYFRHNIFGRWHVASPRTRCRGRTAL